MYNNNMAVARLKKKLNLITYDAHGKRPTPPSCFHDFIERQIFIYIESWKPESRKSKIASKMWVELELFLLRRFPTITVILKWTGWFLLCY